MEAIHFRNQTVNAGEMLAAMPKQNGARGVGKKVDSYNASPLSDLGISYDQSSRWQKLASVPESEKGTSIVCTLGEPVEEPHCLQFIPEERGSNDAEREPERVPVEPETPDVAVPAKPAQHITRAETTLQAEPYDISAERDLANAVLCRALEDAQSDPVARRWFEASHGMLEFWCQVAGLDPGRVKKRAQQICPDAALATL